MVVNGIFVTNVDAVAAGYAHIARRLMVIDHVRPAQCLALMVMTTIIWPHLRTTYDGPGHHIALIHMQIDILTNDGKVALDLGLQFLAATHLVMHSPLGVMSPGVLGVRQHPSRNYLS